MSKPEDKNPGKRPPVERDGVSHDARGNAVWKWAVDSGRYLLENTSLLLKRLDVPGLKLEEDASAHEKKSVGKANVTAAPTGSAGYDPYGHKRVAAPPRPRPAATKPAAAPRRHRSWLQRLFRRD